MGDVTGVRLLSSSEPTAVNVSLTSSSQIVTTEDSPDVTISIHASDIESILTSPPLLQSRNSSFIQLVAMSFQDLRAIQILTSDVLQATVFNGDFTPPELDSWTLDLDSGEVVLTFDEPINASTAQSTLVILQNGPNRTSSLFLRLPNIVPSAGISSNVVSISINQTVIDLLQAIEIGLSETTTYLTLDVGFVEDVGTIRSAGVAAAHAPRCSVMHACSRRLSQLSSTSTESL